jgi:hypothetical protein
MKNKEKIFIFNVELKFSNIVNATSKNKAIEILKESFMTEYNIELDEKEFTLIDTKQLEELEK